MRKFLPSIALFAAALSATTFAATAVSAGAVQKHFIRDGESFSYTMIQKGDHVVLTGLSETTGQPFELVVRGDRITGTSNGVPVSFRVANAQAKISASTTELAAR